MPKILIIRFSSIGDIVLTSPVIRNLKQQLPSAEIHFCTKAAYRTLVENNPHLSRIHYLEKNLYSLIERLKQEKYDYVIDLHNNLRSRIVKFRLGAKAFTFNKLNFRKWLLVNLKMNTLPDLHIVDRYMETLERLNIKNDGAGLDYFIPERDIVKTDSLPEAYRKGYYAYAIGAQHNTKKLPPDRIIELCEKIEAPVILLGDKNDAETARYVEAYFIKKNKTFRVYNACGKFNLNQSASVIKNSLAVFTHDTGLMHIASAFKKKVYSLWGNTVPEFGMYPYKTDYEVLERKGLSCRPCSKIGYKECPKGHFKCMNEIDFGQISIKTVR
ncbi:MAG: glycosyltransferase family 9 protein [Cytophagaceae bacterium]